MTIRQLRQMLTEVDNQEMTIRELRAALFEQQEQDEELTGVMIHRIAYESDRRANN